MTCDPMALHQLRTASTLLLPCRANIFSPALAPHEQLPNHLCAWNLWDSHYSLILDCLSSCFQMNLQNCQMQLPVKKWCISQTLVCHPKRWRASGINLLGRLVHQLIVPVNPGFQGISCLGNISVRNRLDQSHLSCLALLQEFLHLQPQVRIGTVDFDLQTPLQSLKPFHRWLQGSLARFERSNCVPLPIVLPPPLQ